MNVYSVELTSNYSFHFTACTTGDLRLAGTGAFANQGRVEVCNNGAWGTVCDDFWGTVDASVACRQLGFSRNSECLLLSLLLFHTTVILFVVQQSGNVSFQVKSLSYFTDAIAYSRAFYGQGTGSIWLDNVQCTGSESRLFDCPANTVGSHNCGHSEDAGASCQVLGKWYLT